MFSLANLRFSFRRPRWTTTRAMLVMGTALAGVLLLLIHGASAGSRAAVLAAGTESVRREGEIVAARVTQYLAAAPRAVEHFRADVRVGAIDPLDADRIEIALRSILLREPDLAEAAFTHADVVGHTPDGAAVIAAAGRWSIVLRRRGAAIDRTRIAPAEEPAPPRPDDRSEDDVLADPVASLTVLTPLRADLVDRTLFSDLHADGTVPDDAHPLVVTVQGAVRSRERVIGVVRTAIRADRLGELVRASAAPHETVLLIDRSGRLVSRRDAADELFEIDGDRRFRSAGFDAPAFRSFLDAAAPAADGRSSIAAEVLPPFGGLRDPGFAVFRPLEDSTDWLVALLAPRSAFTAEVLEAGERLYFEVVGAALVLAAIGAAFVRTLGRGLGRLIAGLSALSRFEFAAASAADPFGDVAEALQGIEGAKRSLRALTRYAPVGLVRRLHADGAEPALGGESRELAILFTDIRGFTARAEALGPNALAEALGRYLETLTGAIHGTNGTVDKFIGDAVMAFWNAPDPIDDPCGSACAAIRAALRAFAAAPDRSFETRFGLHFDRVLVGHFGAPDRFNYTALGDGVNLASRLESLNEEYGTQVLVSRAVVDRAPTFTFRFIDRVVVKGRRTPTEIWSLVAEPDARTAALDRAYRAAHDLYGAGAFAAAADAFARLPGDPPAQSMARRATALSLRAPADFDGIHRLDRK